MAAPSSARTQSLQRRVHSAPIPAAILIIGCLAVLFLAQLPGVRPAERQTERDRVSWTVWDGHSLGQVFRITPAETVGVRLWLTFPAGQPAGSIQADLFSFDFNRGIASTTIDTSQIKPDAPTTFWFPAITAENWPADQPLTVELRLITHGVAETIPVGGLGSSNRYGYGTLVIDSEQFPNEDLAFVVLERGSFLDPWLPISAMATSRPGVFGWSPLYALLVWLMLWAAGVLMFLLARAITQEPSIDAS